MRIGDQGMFYVASSQPTDAEAAVRSWLMTGMLRVSDPSKIKMKSTKLYYLPFCRLECSYHAPWSVETGQVDQGALSMAWNQYRMAENQYFSLSEHQRRFARGPVRPNETDFLRWYQHSGTETGEWMSPTVMTGQVESYGFDERFEEWANKMLSIFIAPASAVRSANFVGWAENVRSGRDALLEPLSVGSMVSRFQEPLTKVITGRLNSQLPKYHRHVQMRIDARTSTFSLGNWTILPVYVIQYEVSGRTGTCLVDGISASLVVGARHLDISGTVRRFFKSFRRADRKMPGPPNLVTFDDSPTRTKEVQVFVVGDIVMHPSFGRGEVTEVLHPEEDVRVLFEKNGKVYPMHSAYLRPASESHFDKQEPISTSSAQ